MNGAIDPRIALGIDPASEPLCVAELDWRIVPYKRATQRSKYADDVKRYHADGKHVATVLRMCGMGKRGPLCGRYRVGVLVRVKPCASGPNRGNLPGNVGDHDNYCKAVLDAMKQHRLTEGDDARYYAGPAPVLVGGELVASGWELAEMESTVITVWRAWDAQGVGDE